MFEWQTLLESKDLPTPACSDLYLTADNRAVRNSDTRNSYYKVELLRNLPIMDACFDLMHGQFEYIWRFSPSLSFDQRFHCSWISIITVTVTGVLVYDG